MAKLPSRATCARQPWDDGTSDSESTWSSPSSTPITPPPRKRPTAWPAIKSDEITLKCKLRFIVVKEELIEIHPRDGRVGTSDDTGSASGHASHVGAS